MAEPGGRFFFWAPPSTSRSPHTRNPSGPETLARIHYPPPPWPPQTPAELKPVWVLDPVCMPAWGGPHALPARARHCPRLQESLGNSQAASSPGAPRVGQQPWLPHQETKEGCPVPSLTSHGRQDAPEIVLHILESQAGLAHRTTAQENQLEDAGLAQGSPGPGGPIHLCHALQRDNDGRRLNVRCRIISASAAPWKAAPSQRHLACRSAPHLPFWKVGRAIAITYACCE